MTLYEKYEQAREEYLASLKILTKSKSTYFKYEYILGKFGEYIKEHGGDEAEVPPLFIVGWRNEVKENRGLANNSLRHYLTLLHSFFKWTIEHKIFTEQPVGKGDLPKRETVGYDLLSEQEIEKILSGTLPPYSMYTTGIRNRALVILILTSGVRVSELTDLRIGDLDFKNHVITVRHGKGDKRRTVTFPEISEMYVMQYLNGRFGAHNAPKNALLFENADKDGKAHKYTRQNITQVVESYVYRLTGHKKIGAHDLRHSYASYMLTHGVPIQEIQALLGHENYSTTLIYASHLCPERVAINLNGIFTHKTAS